MEEIPEIDNPALCGFRRAPEQCLSDADHQILCNFQIVVVASLFGPCVESDVWIAIGDDVQQVLRKYSTGLAVRLAAPRINSISD